MLAANSSLPAQQEVPLPDPLVPQLDASPHVVTPKITVLPQKGGIKLRDGSILPLTYQDVSTKGFHRKTIVAPKLMAVQGNSGVRQGQHIVRPFGSKGQVFGLAFHNGLFVPPAGEKIQPAIASAARASLRSFVNSPNGLSANQSAGVYGIIQFNGHVTDETNVALKSLGVELLGYYPNAASLARIPANAFSSLQNLPGVRWVGHPTADQKIHHDLKPALTAMAEMLGKKQKVLVSFFTHDASGSMRSDLSAMGAKLGYYDKGIAVQAVEADPATINRLLNLNSVLFVEPDREAHALTEFGSPAIDADYLWGSFAPGPSTTQVKVGLLDSGWYSGHTDFANLLSPGGGWLGYSLISGEHWYNDLNHHGTHVAGTIAGEGRGNYRYRGVGADLTSHGDSSNPDVLVAQVLDSTGSGPWSTIMQGMDLLDAGSGVPGYKRQVWNCSIGGGGYPSDAPSRKVDQAFADGILPVIAAGNSGPGANTVGAPGCAKGALTVGAVYSDDINGLNALADQITDFSSRGPGDPGVGHIHKPDIAAPGAYIDSVKSGTFSDYLFDWAGTSMAAPHITGLAAGLMGHYNFPAWSIKSIILANAIDLGYDRNTQGFGKADAMLAHFGIDGGWNSWWWSNDRTGDIKYIDFHLDHAVAQARFVMCYPDPASAPGVSDVLVNDLDLAIQYSANNADLTTDFSGNWGDQDYDPTSSVVVNSAPAGWYRIKVHSFNVSGSQPWAVTMKWVDTKTKPQLNLSESAPYSVQPNTDFIVYGSAYPDAYVASSVEGYIFLSTGINLGAWVERQSDPASTTEWISLSGGAAYESNHVNMGSAPQWNTRRAAWDILAPSSEGKMQIVFATNSSNSTNGSLTSAVIVDGTPPSLTGIEGLNWTSANNPDVQANVKDVLSGLEPASAQYRYSKNGGSTWSDWATASCSGISRTTTAQTITIPSVPFGQNSASQNLIQISVSDVTGNNVTKTAGIARPNLSSVSITPSAIPGGTTALGKVTLSGPAPVGGALIMLTNTNSKASVPASVNIPGNSTSATFSITAASVNSTFMGTLNAKYAGVTKTKTYTVVPASLKSLVISPTTLIGGVENSTGTITLNGTVSVNTPVSLNSSITSAASVPSSAVVPAGASSVTFPVTSRGVTSTQLPIIKASLGTASFTSKITVKPISISSLTLTPTSVKGGVFSTATIMLASPAAVPITLAITSSLPSAANPAASSVTFAAGNQTKTVRINTFVVSSSKSCVISAVGFNTKTATLKVNP